MKANFFIIIFVLMASLCLANKGFAANSSAAKYDDEFEAYEAEFSQNEQKQIYDPLEKINRKIFTFNDIFDRYFIEPITRAYRYSIPKPARKGVHNFVTNLTLPISTVNSFAQGKLDNGLATFSNFLINTTLGIGGLFNVAGDKKINYDAEDFGQTLGHYGVGNGFFLMLPILGPSSGRDFAGNVFDKSIDPISFNLLEIGGSRNAIDNNYRFAGSALHSLDLRESLLDPIDDARKDSFDLYATLRSVYSQQRDAKIKK